MQVQSERQHYLYATRSRNMQLQYGRDRNIHTYWTLKPTNVEELYMLAGIVPIRCNHTPKHTLGSSEMHTYKQRQYKTSDWRCTLHTHPHELLKTMPSTSYTTADHQQNTSHPLTNNNHQSTETSSYFKSHINGIRNKMEELKYLVHSTQLRHYHNTRTKLTQKLNTENTPLHHHTHRQRTQTKRGLITLIKDDITFTNINIRKAINTHNTEQQLVKIQIDKTKHIRVANAYFPPRDTT